jgi:hypothetical protein
MIDHRSTGGHHSQATAWLFAFALAWSTAFAQEPAAPTPVTEKLKSRPVLPPKLNVFKTDVNLVTEPGGPIWSAELTPADFLDNVGDRIKARWRQLYRAQPPPPSVDRQRAAFTLGGLLADCYLTVQATDAQTFRNNSQDLMAYCRVLALGDKLAPRIMSEAKLAEDEKWPELRQDLINGHQELCRFLREQKDDDLAGLVDLGVWLRMVEMVGQMVVETKDPKHWCVSAGSPELVSDLHKRYQSLSELCRSSERLQKLGEVIAYLDKTWSDKALQPTEIIATKSHERVSALMHAMTLK